MKFLSNEALFFFFYVLDVLYVEYYEKSMNFANLVAEIH